MKFKIVFSKLLTFYMSWNFRPSFIRALFNLSFRRKFFEIFLLSNNCSKIVLLHIFSNSNSLPKKVLNAPISFINFNHQKWKMSKFFDVWSFLCFKFSPSPCSGFWHLSHFKSKWLKKWETKTFHDKHKGLKLPFKNRKKSLWVEFFMLILID